MRKTTVSLRSSIGMTVSRRADSRPPLQMFSSHMAGTRLDRHTAAAGRAARRPEPELLGEIAYSEMMEERLRDRVYRGWLQHRNCGRRLMCWAAPHAPVGELPRAWLSDHAVGPHQHRGGDADPERPGGSTKHRATVRKARLMPPRRLLVL